MVLPEGILLGGALAGFRCPLRFRPQEGEMPVTETDLPIGDITFIDLATRASGKTAAVRSLEVAELEHHHRGVRIAFKVAGAFDQVDHQFCLAGYLAQLAG